MKRFVSEVKIGEKIRYRTRIEDEESPPGSDEARIRQYDFMRSLLGQWTLVTCGMQMFQTLKVYHDGTRWIAEAEATVDTDQPHG